MGKSRLRAGIALAVLASGLGGCGGSGAGGGIDWGFLAPEAGWECRTADAWQVRGFDYSHFEARPDELLSATLRRGEVVALDLTNRLSTACGGSVASVQWRSTSPNVGAVAARGPLGADLQAGAPGETRVSAEVTLSDGSRRTAELHAVPSHGSPVLRVHAVRVVP